MKVHQFYTKGSLTHLCVHLVAEMKARLLKERCQARFGKSLVLYMSFDEQIAKVVVF